MFCSIYLSLTLSETFSKKKKKKKKKKKVALLAAADKGPRGLEKFFSDLLGGQAEFFSTLGLPDWLVHWGHPGNMAGAKTWGRSFEGKKKKREGEERTLSTLTHEKKKKKKLN